MSRLVFVFYCAILVLVPSFSNAMTPEQKEKIHAHFEEIGMKCFEEIQITEQDIMDLRAKKLATGPNVPCFLACMFKKVGLLDSDGMLQKESVLDLAKKVFDDEEELKNIHDYLHSCGHVNDVAVSDGDKGCERAMLGIKCMMENSSKFGFEV